MKNIKTYLQRLWKVDLLHKLNNETINSLIQLLHSGFSAKDALDIIKDENNSFIIENITKSLINGETLIDSIKPYLKKNISFYIDCFSKYMTFSDALSFSNELIITKKKRRDELIKILIYPFLLLFGMIIGLLFFAIYLMPAMASLSMQFNINDNIASNDVLIKNIAITIIIIFILLIIILLILFSETFLLKTYSFISKINRKSIIVDLYTEEFVYIYHECLKRGLSTIDSFNIISTIKEKSIPSFIAKSLDSELRKGKDLLSAMDNNYLSSSFIKFLNIALKTTTPEIIIASYVEYIRNRIDNRLKAYAKIVQSVVYGFIGILIIYIYRILMLPLTILENF